MFKETLETLKQAAGSALVHANTIDPSIRNRPHQQIMVLGLGFVLGVTVITVATVYKNAMVWRGIFFGDGSKQ